MHVLKTVTIFHSAFLIEGDLNDSCSTISMMMAVHYALKCYGNSRIRLAIFMNQIKYFRSYQKVAMPKQFSDTDILDYCFDKS